MTAHHNVFTRYLLTLATKKLKYWNLAWSCIKSDFSYKLKTSYHNKEIAYFFLQKNKQQQNKILLFSAVLPTIGSGLQINRPHLNCLL